MSKKLILLTLATILVAALISAGATAGRKQSAARPFSVGIYDDGMTLANPDKGFPILHNLRAQVVRITLWWGGPIGVAKKQPKNPTNPADPAYNWDAYDRAVQDAAKYKIKVLFSIVGTPAWANGGRAARYAPSRPVALQNFATAAAKRYSGTFEPTTDEPALPAVRLWLAWNEPNNPAECVLVRAHLQRDLQRGPQRSARGGKGRLRRHRSAREQPAAQQASLDLAACVPTLGEEVRSAPLRCLGAPSVRAPRQPDAELEAERE